MEKCTYCPGGQKLEYPEPIPEKKPAVMRALETEYDSSTPSKESNDQLEAIGHRVDKVEVDPHRGHLSIPTTHLPEEFVKECLDTLTEPSQNPWRKRR